MSGDSHASVIKITKRNDVILEEHAWETLISLPFALYHPLQKNIINRPSNIKRCVNHDLRAPPEVPRF